MNTGKVVNAQSANLRTTKNCTPNLRRTMGGGDLTVSYRPRVCDGCEFCIGTYCDRDEMDCKCPKCKPEMYGWEVVASANRDNCKKLAELWDKLNWRDYKMDYFEKECCRASGEYCSSDGREDEDEEEEEEEEEEEDSDEEGDDDAANVGCL